MSWTARNGYLTQAEMEGNAQEVWTFFRSRGWSENATAAMLGNMQSESGINPGIWENLTSYTGGYGLTQWTPYTKYSQYAGGGWQNNGEAQCQRIAYEAENGMQWFRNPAAPIVNPPISFAEFTTSNLDVYTLANYFLWFYEHPANPNQPNRGTQAAAWLALFTGQTVPANPTPPDDPALPVSELEIPFAVIGAACYNSLRQRQGKNGGRKI